MLHPAVPPLPVLVVLAATGLASTVTAVVVTRLAARTAYLGEVGEEV